MFYNNFKMHPEIPTKEFKSFLMIANTLIFKSGERTYNFDAVANGVAKAILNPGELKNPELTTTGIQYRVFGDQLIQISKTAFKDIPIKFPSQPKITTEVAMCALDDYLYCHALEVAAHQGKDASLVKAVRVSSIIKDARAEESGRAFEVYLTYPWTPVEKKEIVEVC